MRGSPLVRSLFVLLALIAAAFGIRSIATDPAPRAAEASPGTTGTDSFFLTFSSRPAEVRLESGGETLAVRPDDVTASGSLTLADDHPTIFVTVLWDHAEESVPRFAKLTLEPPGQPTQTRTFDGFGSIDDVWELHLHP